MSSTDSILSQFSALQKTDPKKAFALLDEMAKLFGKDISSIKEEKQYISKPQQLPKKGSGTVQDLGKAIALFKEKFNIGMKLLAYLKDLFRITQPQLYGSFTRKMFEILFSHNKDGSFTLPDFVSGDLDILLSRFPLRKEKLVKILNKMEVLKETINMNGYIPLHDNWYIVEITNHADSLESFFKNSEGRVCKKEIMSCSWKFLLQQKQDGKILSELSVDIVSHKTPFEEGVTHVSTDFDVNSLQMSEFGITTPKFNFLTVLENIRDHYAKTGFEFHINSSLSYARTFEDKAKILSDPIKLLPKLAGLRLQKIEKAGYRLFGQNIPVSFDIVCPMSELEDIKLPYPTVTMGCCKKPIGLIWLRDFATKGKNAYHERLQCPYCRADFSVKTEEIPRPTPSIFDSSKRPNSQKARESDGLLSSSAKKRLDEIVKEERKEDMGNQRALSREYRRQSSRDQADPQVDHIFVPAPADEVINNNDGEEFEGID